MSLDLEALRRELEDETHRYLAEYEPPGGTFGTPWSRERVAAALAEMRRCLIVPYWMGADIQDPPDNYGGPYQRLPCIAVAEDGDACLMVFVPQQNTFLLLWPYDGGWRSIGLYGDAVGTFLGR